VLTGPFNGFLKAVILRLSEARDLGEFDRFKFYDHLKAYTAAPPDVLRVNEKHIREYAIQNCCGIIITTNHRTDGIYLPADDRRHFVLWSHRNKEDPLFQGHYWSDMWTWYTEGGMANIAAFLRQRDLSGFNAKAPPPKTKVFWDIVNTNRSPEDAELADAIDNLGGDALMATTLKYVSAATSSTSFGEWLDNRKNRRNIPHRFEACGFTPVRNPDANDGLWKISGSRQVVYARTKLSEQERLNQAKQLCVTPSSTPF
jgi:hypothetical protein